MPPRPGACGVGLATQPGPADLLVQFGDQLIQLAGVFPGRLGVIPPRLGLGAVFDSHRLHLIWGRRFGDRFGVQVPAFGALGSAEHLDTFGAG
jgi:hypothetical protein